MTDRPIPDDLRDRFAKAAALSQFDAGASSASAAHRWLDYFAAAGFHIELRLPEFAVHDDTCCGGSELVGSYFDGQRLPDEPCPGVGYYHWKETP